MRVQPAGSHHIGGRSFDDPKGDDLITSHPATSEVIARLNAATQASADRAAMLENVYSTGQICTNGTRVFVHSSMLEDVFARLKTRTKLMKLGDPMDPDRQTKSVFVAMGDVNAAY